MKCLKSRSRLIRERIEHWEEKLSEINPYPTYPIPNKEEHLLMLRECGQITRLINRMYSLLKKK